MQIQFYHEALHKLVLFSLVSIYILVFHYRILMDVFFFLYDKFLIQHNFLFSICLVGLHIFLCSVVYIQQGLGLYWPILVSGLFVGNVRYLLVTVRLTCRSNFTMLCITNSQYLKFKSPAHHNTLKKTKCTPSLNPERENMQSPSRYLKQKTCSPSRYLKQKICSPSRSPKNKIYSPSGSLKMKICSSSRSVRKE